MRFHTRRLPAAGAILFVFGLAATSSQAANLNRFFDSGQPRELINQPMCWSAEGPDDPRYCDFANKI